jgi:hypothetical protein
MGADFSGIKGLGEWSKSHTKPGEEQSPICPENRQQGDKSGFTSARQLFFAGVFYLAV